MESEVLGMAEVPAAADIGAPTTERARPISQCDVAGNSAGPYGLAVAAHLRAAGFAARAFGHAMVFWRRNMPKGMKLRHATSICGPDDSFTLEAFGREHPDAATRPLPIETFIAYAE